MRGLAVLAPRTVPGWRRPQVFSTNIHGTHVTFSLVQQQDVDFAVDDELHARSVLVRVHAFSCNYREKTRFLHVARQAGWGGYVVLGSEFAGTVLKVGAAVAEFAPGDPVCGNGSVDPGLVQPGLATQRASLEMQIHHHSKLFKLPQGMTFIEGAAFSLGAQTAYSMVDRLQLAPRSQVAVTAAASNASLFAIKALLARGHLVHALTTSSAIVDHLHALGVGQICKLSRAGDATAAIGKHLRRCGLSHFDAVVDPFCDLYLRSVLPWVRRFGSYVTCGFERQLDSAEPQAERAVLDHEILSLLIRKSVTLVGNNLGTRAHLEQAAADYMARRLPIDIDTVVTDGDLATLIGRSFLVSDRVGKVVFAYDGPA